MQFDDRERKPIFYVILFGLLIFAIVFFVSNVKKAIDSSKAKEEVKDAEASIVIFEEV